MFQGANPVSGAVFQAMVEQVAQGNNVGNVGDNIAAARKEAIDRAREKEDLEQEDLLLNSIVQTKQAMAGQGVGLTTRQLQQGYGDVQNPALFQFAQSLPFNEETAQSKNYSGIVNSYDPQMFMRGEQMIQQVENMEPYARRVLTHRSSIYEKYPADPMVNRMNIILTRMREDSLYAFV